MIKLIKVNVIYTASDCYFVQISITLYLGIVTICYPTTEKNHPVNQSPVIRLAQAAYRLDQAGPFRLIQASQWMTLAN